MEQDLVQARMRRQEVEIVALTSAGVGPCDSAGKKPVCRTPWYGQRQQRRAGTIVTND